MRYLLPILCLLLLRPAAASAYEWRAGEGTNTIVLPADATVTDETLFTGYRVEIQGQAEKDLWLGGSTSVKFDGTADGDLRILAGSAILTGEARQNLMASANGLQLTSNSVVRGEVALFGNTVICEGLVEGPALIFAQSLTLGGHWDGSVRIYAQKIRVVPGTTIAGDLIYTAPTPLILDSSVEIGGELTQQKNVIPATDGFSLAAFRARAQFLGYLFLAALLAGMPFVGFFPAFAGQSVRQLRTAPWRVLLAGILTVLVLPAMIGFIFLTAVGIPLAVLLGALYLCLVYLSHIVIALWLGHKLLRAPGPQSFSKVLAALATGLFILYAAAAIPGVAGFIAMPIVILGSGSLALALFQRPKLTIQLPPPPPLSNSPESIENPE